MNPAGADTSNASLASGFLRLQNPVIVDDLAADNRQQRTRTLEVFIGNREAVSIKHCKVTVVADFNRAKIVLPDEPFVGGCSQPEHLLTHERLIAQDLLSGEISARYDRKDVQPRIDDCDVAAV